VPATEQPSRLILPLGEPDVLGPGYERATGLNVGFDAYVRTSHYVNAKQARNVHWLPRCDEERT